MKGSWRLACLAGININVHWSFSFVILWVILQGIFGYGDLETTLFGLIAVLLLFGCVILHELGHALMALRLNIVVKNIILLPIGGLAQMQTLPQHPLHELLIAGAGPLVNLALVFVLIPLAFIFTEETLLLQVMTSPDVMIEALMRSFFRQGALIGLIIFLLLTNIILFVFNLIPALPMDGGRILRAVLALVMPYPRATKVALVVGQLTAMLVVFLALYFKSPGLFLVAIFVFIAGRPMKV